MEGLKNKHVLVTGASSGIGQAIALRFAREGCNVAINYRSDRKGAEQTLKSARPGRHVIIQADVSREEDVRCV